VDGYSGQTETMCVIPSLERCSSETAADKLMAINSVREFDSSAYRHTTSYSLAEINLVLDNCINTVRLVRHDRRG